MQKNKISPLKPDRWDELLIRAKSSQPSLYTVLRMAQPSIDEGKLILAFRFPLHQKKAKSTKNIAALAQLIEELSGDKLPIECIVDKKLSGDAPERPRALDLNPAPASAQLQTISNIFGPAEVLES